MYYINAIVNNNNFFYPLNSGRIFTELLRMELNILLLFTLISRSSRFRIF